MTEQYAALTDSQWSAISEIMDTKRKRKVCLRAVVDALRYLCRTGCQWRNLPPNFPHWRAVNYYFETWKANGLLVRMNQVLNEQDRKAQGREANPSLLCVDSQSIKLNPMIAADRGIDGNKKVNGRKRQFLVDSNGRIHGVCAHAANIADGKGAVVLLDTLNHLYAAAGGRLSTIMGDTAYNAIFAQAVTDNGVSYQAAARPESSRGFVPIATRWVVERTIT